MKQHIYEISWIVSLFVILAASQVFSRKYLAYAAIVILVALATVGAVAIFA